MMVSNHFDVRWVDGYSAVSDVPSSLAAKIEKMAADLPDSHDQIEVAVRDVRRTDGTRVWVGLLRFVVAVSSAPRPLGFLHAAVLPSGYRLDLTSWRALVARRYGAHPEERIRALYEDLAESTKDTGRGRLRALAIRPEDVLEVLALDETEHTPIGVKVPTRPSRPGSYPRAASAGPKVRASQPSLSVSVRPGPSAEPATERMDVPVVDDLPADADPDLPNDVTQPMEAPSGTAAPLSGEHPQQVQRARPARSGGWRVAGAAIGAVALLLAAMGWLAHRHRALVDERDELLRRHPDQEAWQREKKQLEDELAKARAQHDGVCTKQVVVATEKCEKSLIDVRDQARTALDNAERQRDELRLQLTEANLRNTTLLKSKDEAEQRARAVAEEQKRTSDERTRLEGENKQLEEVVKALCKGLQSGRKAPKECQGI